MKKSKFNNGGGTGVSSEPNKGDIVGTGAELNLDNYGKGGSVKNLTQKEGELASEEGWLISNNEKGETEIQKDDESEIFKNDSEALKFVSKKALEGSKLHEKALIIISQKIKHSKGATISDSDVNELVSGYKQAILFTDSGEDEDSIDSELGIHDFDSKSDAAITKMAKQYIADNKEAIEKSGLDYEQIGMDIWYTQAGHGVGFFDRGISKELVEKLEDGAQKFGNFPNVFSQDGKVYIEGMKFSMGGFLNKAKESMKSGIATGKKGFEKGKELTKKSIAKGKEIHGKSKEHINKGKKAIITNILDDVKKSAKGAKEVAAVNSVKAIVAKRLAVGGEIGTGGTSDSSDSDAPILGGTMGSSMEKGGTAKGFEYTIGGL